MWDSAKKPIKVRSVLQRNGMRHFIVNEDTDEIYSSFHQRRNKSIRGGRHPPNEVNLGNPQHQQDGSNTKILAVTKKEQFNSHILLRSLTLNDSSPVREEWNEFFGVEGSKICNKKHKGRATRYFHQLSPHYSKENSEIFQLPKDVQTRPRRESSDLLNLVPVKSPVIKKLISGGGHKESVSNPQSEGSTTLCSRIMTWIDLEVKRNGGKKAPSSLSFTSADLNIVNGLSLQDNQEESSTSSDSNASSEESNNCLSSSSCSSSSSFVSLPKLVPCWRKEIVEGNNKAKKSVRISDDLPRWGKMKRRLRRKDRSMSVDELYNDNQAYHLESTFTDHRRKPGSNLNKSYVSSNQLERQVDEDWNEDDKLETDSFVVCDQRGGLSSGKVQVHIFLPHTESHTGVVSARSEDSTS